MQHSRSYSYNILYESNVLCIVACRNYSDRVAVVAIEAAFVRSEYVFVYDLAVTAVTTVERRPDTEA